MQTPNGPHMQEDQMPAPRRRVLKGVRLAFNAGRSTMNGLMRDISDTGARVSVENSLTVPDTLTLLFPDGSRRECRVARRELRELGLHFL
jgi:PilZ domain